MSRPKGSRNKKQKPKEIPIAPDKVERVPVPPSYPPPEPVGHERVPVPPSYPPDEPEQPYAPTPVREVPDDFFPEQKEPSRE